MSHSDFSATEKKALPIVNMITAEDLEDECADTHLNLSTVRFSDEMEKKIRFLSSIYS